MDASEDYVRRYLAGLGYQDIRFEPNGNIPPDFVVDGRVAVEVRRLNQNFRRNGRSEGLETRKIELHRMIVREMANCGRPNRGQSWFVFFSFRRPLPATSVLRKSTREVLRRFKEAPHAFDREIEVSPTFTIKFFPSSKLYPSLYVLGGYADYDDGGFVGAIMFENLRLCIAEKTEKIRPHRSQYPEWWLILVDLTAIGADQDDMEGLSIPHTWDRVLIVDLRRESRRFEIKRGGLISPLIN